MIRETVAIFVDFLNGAGIRGVGPGTFGTSWGQDIRAGQHVIEWTIADLDKKADDAGSTALRGATFSVAYALFSIASAERFSVLKIVTLDDSEITILN